MKTLTHFDCAKVSGGVLTDKQVENLLAKTGGYVFRASFLGILAATTKLVSLPAFLIGGVAAPVASLIGTYFVYENKDYVTQLMNDAKNSLSASLNYF